MTNPADLNITPQPDTDKNFFNFKAVGLKINKTYAIKFQWIYDDLTLSDWSPGFFVTTSNETAPAVPSSASVPGSATGSIPVTLSAFPTNAKRVDVVITNGIFGTATVAHSFTTAGTATIAAPAGTYIVQLRSISPTGVTSTVGTTFTITIADVGETIQAPTNPNGFSIDRILSGIQVNWAGTYANGTFTGFEAIKIYVGNSATATGGSYKDAGVMTGNNVANSITIPVDGVYLRYDLPVYIHAAAINKSGTVGTLQANVANNSLGARSAIGSDLADLIITNGKLVDDAVSAAKIATAAITTTKIADDAITTPKLVANAITADKIVSSAITADKIATNAITAGKILAGTIDVTKLAAGTISTNNLEAGVITSTSYIRAGSKNVGAGTGARVEMSSSLIEDGVVDIEPGFYIYNSAGTPILSAPLTGGLSITGGGTFTGALSGASGTFNGNITASNGLFSVNNGILTASSGTIGGWSIGSTLTATVSNNTITLDPATPRISLINSTLGTITIDPVSGIVGPNVTIAGNTGPGFSFSPDGTASLRGSIYATVGTIGGWTLGASSFTGGGTSLNSSGTISLTGGTVSGNGESFAAGNLTLNSGAITSNSSLFLTANDLYYDSNFAPTGLSYPNWVQGSNATPINYYIGSRCTYNNDQYRCVQYHQSTGSTPNLPSTAKSGGYLWVEEANSLLYVDSGANVHIGERGTFFTSITPTKRNALSFRINTYDRGDGYYGRGYVLAALDTSEFKYSTSASGITAPTVVVGFYGQLYNGRAFYYGSAGTSSAINTEVGGSIGDVYFSTV